MNQRLVRTSAALAVAVSLGAVAPASSAAPAKQPNRKAQTVKIARPAKVSSLVEAARRRVVVEIVRDDRALASLLARPSVPSLDADARADLGASVAGDRALLAELATRARAATTLAELKEVSAVVRQLRPEIYNIAVGQLQDLAALAAAAEAHAAVLDELDAIVAELEAAGQDVSALQADLAEARLINAETTLAVPAARDGALLLTALSPRTEVQAVTAEVLCISGLLDRVDETIMLVELALAESVEEPAPEEELASTA